MKYLLFGLALSACSSVVAPSEQAATGMTPQQHSKWCWAALVENLTQVPQCEVPSVVYPTLADVDCCTSYQDACNVQGNVQVGLDKAAGVDSVYQRTALSEEELSAELGEGRKVVAHIRNELSGHVILITDRVGDQYSVYDPAFDRLQRISYEQIVHGLLVHDAPVTWQATTWKIGQPL